MHADLGPVTRFAFDLVLPEPVVNALMEENSSSVRFA